MNSLRASSLLMLPLLSALSLRAQVPDGWLLTGNFRWSGTAPCAIPGPGGLFYLDPRGGAVQPVTGLPPDVTGNIAASTLLHGADFAVRIPSSEQLVTNGWGDSTVGRHMPLFVLHMQGSAVMVRTRHDVGILGPMAVNFAGLPQAAVLPDGRVLLCVDPNTFQTGELLSTTVLAVFDPTRAPGSAGELAAVPVSPLPPGSPNALAFDPDRGVAWVGVFQLTQSTLYSIPYPQGGAPTQSMTFPSVLVTGLAVENDGSLLVTGRDLANDAAILQRLDPAVPAAQSFPQLRGLVFAETVRVDPVTGNIYVVAGSGCTNRNVYRIAPADPVQGVISLVTSGPAGGWGIVSGLDLNPDPEAYGAASGASTLPVRWGLSPNAGGLPRLGNSGFALELEAPAPPLAAGVLLGLSRNMPPSFPGLQILLDPLVSYLLPPAASMPVPLGIPANPSLIGLPVFGQGVFLDSAFAVGATAGVHVTVLP